jgi:copper chaperone CopZ
MARSSLSVFIAPTLIAAAIFLFGCASDGGAASGENLAPAHTANADDVAYTKSKQALPADMNPAVLYVNGMGCPLCATNVDMQLLRLPAVEKVDVDLSTGRIIVALRAGVTPPSPARLHAAVEDAGFTLVKIATK